MSSTGYATWSRTVPSSQELRLLTRDQVNRIRLQARLVNQGTACLEEHYPVALQLFAKLNQPATLAFLRA